MKTLLLPPFLFLITACCCTSRLSKEVSKPRDGQPIKSKIAVVYSSNYQISLAGLERLHPFDIQKYKRIFEQLVKDSLVKTSDIFVPEPITKDDILRVHTDKFLNSLKSSKNIAAYIEAPLLSFLPAFILKRAVLRPFQYASGGTLLASRNALLYGVGINIGGGYHHAKPDAGEGFCVYADIPIAIRILQAEGKIKRALVIDLDVHQGNGTAVCLANDDRTFTFSMHQGSIYPIPKEISDLDIELNAGMDDETYLKILSKNLPSLFEKAKPDIVFLVAGCDTFKDDPLASINMTGNGIVKRDWMVIDECLRRNIPIVMTLAGGYSKEAWHIQYKSIRNILEKINPAG